MGALRTEEMEERYRTVIREGALSHGCRLCAEKSMVEFKFWRIIHNGFPYDKIARVHHMIIPKRCVEEKDLTPEENKEYLEIKETYINENYGHILEAVKKGKSIPGHFHLHLLVLDEAGIHAGL